MFVTSVVGMRVCGGAGQSSLSEEKCEGGPLGQRELLGRLPTQEGKEPYQLLCSKLMEERPP